LRHRPFVGGNKAYPFQVAVSAPGDEVQTHAGEVNDRGIIPIWVIPLVIVLCALLACLGVFIYNWLRSEAPPAATDDSWVRVQEAGVLRVATSADYPPFSYYNQDHVIDGFDPALIRDIGTVLGIQVQISDYAFEGLGATLNVGQADAAIAAISVTPERETQFDFSNIYYVSQDGILARADSGINSVVNLGDIAGKRVGVQQFTVYENWAQDILVGGGIISQDQLFAFAKPEHAIDDLRHGRIDLVIMDLQPAIALSDPELKLVGQGLNPQRLAIALPKGANALRAKVNEALLDLQNQGRVTQLVQHYLGLKPEDIIPPPTPEPTPEITVTPIPTATQNPTPEGCTDAMEFVEDLNFDDEDLTNFPLVDPGQAFQKGWRIRNSGTCTWNSTYFIQYIRGGQMGGQPTAIRGAVEPGQTYDMYVDLVAPDAAGEHVGYWQMHNTENRPFGQTVWVAVEVRNTNPEIPTATVTPETTPTPTEGPSPEPTITETPPAPTATEEPGADLRDKTWILEGYLANLDDAGLTDPLANVDVELTFQEEGNLSGNGGCNNFTGRYVTDGTAIAIREILATKLSCADPAGIMEQENTFLQLLDQTEEYRINQDRKLEIIREVIENQQPVKKVILLFGE
jgi:polar amino acid transport system substrate-binding protein